MKIKSKLLGLFIIIAIIISGINLYRIFAVNNTDSQHIEEHDHDHEHVEENEEGHDHSFEDFNVTFADFKGIKSDTKKDNIQSTFLAANNRNIVAADNIICKNNSDNNIFWYSEADNCVYTYANGKSEKLFDKRASGLNIYNNALYFISPEEELTTDEALPAGHIWKYDFTTKNLSVFSDISATTLCVINNQFYCMAITEEELLPYMITDDGNYVKINMIFCGSYLNYSLAHMLDAGGFSLLCLIDSQSNEQIPLVSNDVSIIEQNIYKDTLYYRYFVGINETDENFGNILSLNLITGEEKVYNIENAIGQSYELSYNFANDNLYLLSENVIAIINLKTDEVIKHDIQSHEHDEESHSHSMYNRLYSDGETIYIIDDSDSKEQLITIDDFITN